MLNAAIKSGTNVAKASASANIMALSNSTCTVFLWDAQGNGYADIAYTATFDREENDAELCRAIDLQRNAPGLVRTAWDDLVRYGKEDLERTGLLTINNPHDIFLNYSGATRLLLGNAWQQEIKIRQLSRQIEYLAHKAGIDTKLLDGDGPPMDTNRDTGSLKA